MPNNQPTQAELDEQIRLAEEEAEKTPAPTPSEPDPSEPVPTPSPEVPSPSEPVPTPSPEIPVEPSKEIKEGDTDYKKKFVESQREALVQYGKNKRYQEVSKVPEPTIEELQLEFTEWEEMTPTEQRLAKDSLWNNRKFAVIDQVNKDSEDIDAWNTKVDDYVVDPKVLVSHPELEGKTDDFKIFATKPTRRGVDLEDLVLAFNGERALHQPKPKVGQMFENGSGGPNDKPKPKDDKISLDEAAVLMKTNYNKYKEYLVAGKIREM